MGRGRRHQLVVTFLVAVAAAACQSPDGAAPAASPGPGTQVGVPDPDDIDPARLAALQGLPDCPAPPQATPGTDVGDLPVPAEAVITAGSSDGGLTSVQGYTPRTPVEVMVDYLRLDGWTVLSAEDEVFEAELLLERDGLRLFAKAQATCERGSAFVLFGSSDPALVPAPAGG